MDPVSAILGNATSITALIKTGQTIYGWVQSFQEATGTLRELRILLIEFNRLLANLQHDLDDENVRLRIPPEETNIIIGGAKETLRKLQAAMEGVRRGDGNDARRIQWLLNEKRCQSLQQRLTRHRDSFQGIYNTIQSVQIESHRRLSENTLQLMREMHAMMGGNRPLLLQYSTETLESMGGEADVVITKTTDVILTKDDEDDAQVYPEEKASNQNTLRSTNLFEERALIQSSSPTFSSDLPKHSKRSDSSCSCQRSSSTVPSHLDPGRKASSPRFTTQFVRRCSNPECPARKGPSRGSLVMSAKKLKQVIGITLKTRSFHSLIHIEYEGVTTQENTETVILTTTTDMNKLRKLLESGLTSVRERNADNWTLLHIAAYFGTAEQVRFLIKAGSDVDAGEIGNRKVVHFALKRAYAIDATQADRDKLEAFPNWRNAHDDFNFTPIHIAVLELFNFQDKQRSGLLELIDFIDKLNNAPPGQKWTLWKKKYHKESPLFLEIIEAFREEQVRLHRRGSSAKPYINMIEAVDSQNCSPFDWAAQTGRLDKLRILLSRLANPYRSGKLLRNNLHQGSESRQPGVVEFLLSIPPRPIEGG